MKREIEVFPDHAALALAAAERVTAWCSEAIAQRGVCRMALTGGESPKPLYALLARPPFAERLDWSRMQIFWGDERCVPPDDERSNYRLAWENLLNRVPIAAEQIHRVRGELPPADAAEQYEVELRACRMTPAGTLDIILLGMGADGHTASLFPSKDRFADRAQVKRNRTETSQTVSQADALHERERWVVAQPAKMPPLVPRVTLTPLAINAARHILFLVTGEQKAKRVAQVLAGPYQPDELPAQAIIPQHGDLHWFLDHPAASQL
jgi:6-phosphogluconolactonase